MEYILKLKFLLPVHLFKPHQFHDVRKHSSKPCSIKHSSKHGKATWKLAAALSGFSGLSEHTSSMQRCSRDRECQITGYVTCHQKRVANSHSCQSKWEPVKTAFNDLGMNVYSFSWILAGVNGFFTSGKNDIHWPSSLNQITNQAFFILVLIECFSTLNGGSL